VIEIDENYKRGAIMVKPVSAIGRAMERVIREVPGVHGSGRRLCRGIMATVAEIEVQLYMLGLPDRVDVTQTPEGIKMLRGDWYRFGDPILTEARDRAAALYSLYNQTGTWQQAARRKILEDLLGGIGEGAGIRPPFHCDYGFNIVLGDGVDINFNCVFLDCGKVTIGDRVLIAPNVRFYTVGHSLDPGHRARGLERAKPITVESDVWIAGDTTILPGVTIGEGSFVGPKSLVRENIPPYVHAEGNPCQIVRKVERRELTSGI